MHVKKTVLSIVLLVVVSTVLTTLWYLVTDDANMVSFRRDQINYNGLMLNHLIFVLGIVYLFPMLLEKHNTVLKSFWFGMVLAAIMFIPTGCVVRSIWQVDFNTIFILNSIAHLAIGGVLGLIFRIIHNYKKS